MKWYKKLSLNSKNIFFIIFVALIMFILIYSIKMIKIEKTISLQDWISVASSISQFLLVILGLFVFVQIKIAKDAFKTGCERDALRKSVDLAYLFANDIIPKIGDYHKGLQDKGFIPINRKLDHFCMDDINNLSKEEKEKCQKDINFFDENKKLRGECTHILNNLEAFAINFTKLVADEKSLFTAVSQAYCSFVERNYAVICCSRNKKEDLYYVNMIDLYKEWSNRIKLEGLMVESKGLNEKVAESQKMCNNKFKPKGA